MLISPANVAVATCHASRCVTVSGANLFYEAVIEEFFKNGCETLGEAVWKAKQKVISGYPGDDWLYGPAVLQTVLGDPALRIITPVAVAEHALPNGCPGRMTVHPNPFGEKTTLVAHLQEGEQGIAEIFDISGKCVESFCVTNGEKVDIGENLPAGVYFLLVKGGAGSTGSVIDRRKIIKVRSYEKSG